MTRFARAKGSKGSNEKNPEEATSWSEMKEAMLKKKSNKSDINEEQHKIPMKQENLNTTNQSEWASLGDDSPLDFLKSEMLKRRKKKEQEKQVSEQNIKKKKAKSKIKSNNVIDNTSNLKVQLKTKNDTTPVKNKNNSPKKLVAINNNKLSKKAKNKNSESNSLVNPVSVEQKVSKKGKKVKNQSVTNSDATSNEKKLNKKMKPNSVNESDKQSNNSVNKPKKRLLAEASADSSAEVPVKKKKKLDKVDKSNTNNVEENSKEKNITNKKNKKFDQNKQNNKLKNQKNSECNQKANNKKPFNEKNSKNFNDERKFKNDKSTKYNEVIDEVIVNGEKVSVVKFRGFPVLQEDAERLEKLNTEMIKTGIPKDKREAALKLERRRAEKTLSRLKKAVCFHCRGSGHYLSSCPVLNEKPDTSTGICYKCGSTEHSAFNCKVVKGTSFQYAECFICKEQGHIARQCPDNPRGLYPNGGACRECGDVTHLRKDCPQTMSKKMEEAVTAELRDDRNLECLDEEIVNKKKNEQKKVKKTSIKF